jgi:hypothetical protein
MDSADPLTHSKPGLKVFYPTDAMGISEPGASRKGESRTSGSRAADARGGWRSISRRGLYLVLGSQDHHAGLRDMGEVSTRESFQSQRRERKCRGRISHERSPVSGK